MDSQIFSSIFSINTLNLLNLIFNFTINFAVFFIVIYFIYRKNNSNREYMFSFGVFNIVIFMICYLLSSATLSIGFSFGLFAIFSILRYRTVPIPIKEMTYFFLSISIAIVNALSGLTFGILELLFANTIIIVSTVVFEKLLSNREYFKYIKYEKIELVKPQNHDKLLKDLCERTGLPISRFEIGKIDFLRDTADIRVYYRSNNGHFVDTGNRDDDDDD